MVFHSHLGNQTAQTSSHIVALQGLLNYDLSAFNSVFSQTILSIAMLAVAV